MVERVRHFIAISTETEDPVSYTVDNPILQVEDPENLPDVVQLDKVEKDSEKVQLVLTNGEEEVTLDAEIASTGEERYEGLSNKQSLEDTAMVFVWEYEEPHGLTMRDMSFPIDMIFLDSTGEVCDVRHGVPVDDNRTHAAVSRYAIEAPAGFAEENGIDDGWSIDVGDLVQRRLSQSDVEQLAKANDYIEFGSVGGDPFNDHEVLEDFCEELEEAGGVVQFGDEPREHATGYHDRPIRVFGITLADAEDIWDDYKNEAAAIGSPTAKSAETFKQTPEGVPDNAVPLGQQGEPPEGAEEVEGPDQGRYYIPAGETGSSGSERQPSDEGSEGRRDDPLAGDGPLTPEDRQNPIGSDSHPATWERPDPEELDTYMEEMQETEWWGEGHEKFEASFHGDETTKNDHTVTTEEGETVYEEERAEKHEQWAEELLNEDAATDEGEQPVGMVLLGPAGAGKGWWQEQVEQGEYGDQLGGREFTHLSSDRTKEPIPGYDGENAAEVHDEASDVAKNYLARKAIEDEHNVILDKVAATPENTMEVVEQLQERGYDIRATFVDVPEDRSAWNVVGRYEDEGRFTPPDFATEAREGSRSSFEKVVEEFDIPEEKVGVFNNDVEWGEPPEPVDVGEELLKFYRALRYGNATISFNTIGDEGQPYDRETRKARGSRRRRDSGVDGSGLRSRSGGRHERSGEQRVKIWQLEREAALEQALLKSWRYVDDPSEAPEWADVEEAPQAEDRYRYQTQDSEQSETTAEQGSQVVPDQPTAEDHIEEVLEPYEVEGLREEPKGFGNELVDLVESGYEPEQVAETSIDAFGQHNVVKEIGRFSTMETDAEIDGIEKDYHDIPIETGQMGPRYKGETEETFNYQAWQKFEDEVGEKAADTIKHIGDVWAGFPTVEEQGFEVDPDAMRTPDWGPNHDEAAPLWQVAAEQTDNETAKNDGLFEEEVSEEKREAVKEYQEHTQDIIRQAHGDTVTLYRGLSGDIAEDIKESDGAAEIEHRTLESWTPNANFAKSATGFGADELGAEGVVIEREVPVEQIMMASQTGGLHIEDEEMVVAHEEEPATYTKDQIYDPDVDVEFTTKLLEEKALNKATKVTVRIPSEENQGTEWLHDLPLDARTLSDEEKEEKSILQKPFADYDDFDSCVAANQDKENPEGYCAQVHYNATGEWPGKCAKQGRVYVDDLDQVPEQANIQSGPQGGLFYEVGEDGMPVSPDEDEMDAGELEQVSDQIEGIVAEQGVPEQVQHQVLSHSGNIAQYLVEHAPVDPTRVASQVDPATLTTLAEHFNTMLGLSDDEDKPEIYDIDVGEGEDGE